VLTTAVDPVTKNGLWTMLPSVVPPVKTNYVFLGYYDAKTDGYQYYDKDGVYNGTLHKSGGRMLYAQWRHGTYTISYDLNGGTGGPDPASTILKQSDAAIVPTAVPTREYFDFAAGTQRRTAQAQLTPPEPLSRHSWTARLLRSTPSGRSGP